MMAVPVAVPPWGLIAEKLKAIDWDAIAAALRKERASTYNEELATLEREIARLQAKKRKKQGKLDQLADEGEEEKRKKRPRLDQ